MNFINKTPDEIKVNPINSHKTLCLAEELTEMRLKFLFNT